MHVNSSGWSTKFTRLHVTTMLFADPDYCTRTYVYNLPRVIHVTAHKLHSYLKYVKSHLISKVYEKYPKSIIISSGSSTGAQKPRKFSIPALIATKLHRGRFAGEGSSAHFDQLDLLKGPLFVQTFYTTPSENTKSQLHNTQ